MADKKARDAPIRCECGRVVAFIRDGTLYVRCKRCKRDVAIMKIESLIKAEGSSDQGST